MKKSPWAVNAAPQDTRPPPVVRRLRPSSDGGPTVPHRRPLSATAFPVAGGVPTPFANMSSTSSLKTTPGRDVTDRPRSGRAMSPIERELPRLPGDDQPPLPPDRDIYVGLGACGSYASSTLTGTILPRH